MIKIPDDWVVFAKSIFGDNSPEIRQMTSEDLEEVLRIIRLHDSDDWKAAKRSFDQTSFNLKSDIGAHFVIVDPEENRVVGVTGYYIDDLESEGIYWLGWTYVNPYFRGRGYGSMLMHFVLRTLNRFGARKLYLSTSDLPEYEDAVRFYKKNDFKEEGRYTDYYREGEAKLVLARRL